MNLIRIGKYQFISITHVNMHLFRPVQYYDNIVLKIRP